MARFHVALISTGGTIEKTYDELAGMLVNEVSNLDVMLMGMQLRGVRITRVPLLNKDSSTMVDGDHRLIAETAGVMSKRHDGVVIVHGTDTLHLTGERIAADVHPRVPIVLTGAMRPFELRNSDAMQNLTEALMAVQLAAPGVYAVMHNQLLQFPGVVKDRRRGTFVHVSEIAEMRSSPGTHSSPGTQGVPEDVAGPSDEP